MFITISSSTSSSVLCSLSLLFRWVVNYLYTQVFNGRQRSAGGNFWNKSGRTGFPFLSARSRSLLVGAFPRGAIAAVTDSFFFLTLFGFEKSAVLGICVIPKFESILLSTSHAQPELRASRGVLPGARLVQKQSTLSFAFGR